MLRSRLLEVAEPLDKTAGTVVFEQGQQPDGAYVVVEGKTCLTLLDAASQPIWSKVVGSGAILGLPSSVSGQPYSLRATALEATRLAFVSRDKVTSLMRHDPAMASEILRVLSDELIDLRKKMSMLRSAPRVHA